MGHLDWQDRQKRKQNKLWIIGWMTGRRMERIPQTNQDLSYLWKTQVVGKLTKQLREIEDSKRGWKETGVFSSEHQPLRFGTMGHGLHPI